MVIEVTRIGGDGSIRRAVVDTAGREDWVPVAEHQGRRILYGTGTAEKQMRYQLRQL